MHKIEATMKTVKNRNLSNVHLVDGVINNTFINETMEYYADI